MTSTGGRAIRQSGGGALRGLGTQVLRPPPISGVQPRRPARAGTTRSTWWSASA